MTDRILVGVADPPPVSRRVRVVIAVVASLVLLVAVGVVEVGVLAAVTIVSAGTNRVGGS
jgi:hypothetical protein